MNIFSFIKYFVLALLFFSFLSIGMAREVSTDSSHAMVFEIIQDQLSLNKSDIARAKLMENEQGHYQGLLIQLKPFAAQELERMTKINVGKRVNVVFRGRIISSSLIQAELGDSFLLSSISKEDAMIFIRILNSSNME